MSKLLLIVPHLSTGGLPQVALKKVELLRKDFDVYVMEYKQIAYSYVVQRNKIMELLGDNFISLGRPETEEKRDKFETYFNLINPDVVHMEEIPELFMREEHINFIYNKDRKYEIFETTHTSTFNVKNKKYFPDKFLFMSEHSKEEYSIYDVPSQVIDYPIDTIKRDRDKYIKELDLDPTYFHVLNVGLFTPGKNQGYIFEIAKKMLNFKIQFHFVGNMASNFENYWKPLVDSELENCKIWGERVDVDKFYNMCDFVIFPSVLELNPLTIKEALTYQIPLLINKLKVLNDTYDDDNLVKYSLGDVDVDIDYLLSNFNIRKKYTDSNKFKMLLSDNYNDKNINVSVSKNEIEYNISFVDGAKVEIFGKSGNSDEYDIQFIDKDTNNIEYQTTLKPNHWTKTNTIYYKNWKIVIIKDGEVVVQHDIDLKGKNVYIQFDTKSLGDNVAYIPYVEEFRKIHQCHIICSTFWNNLFEKEYTNIEFINPGESPNRELYAKYNLGWYQPWKSTHNPNDYKKITLQQTATDILGLKYKEIIPNITIPIGERPIEEKYVCIAQFSTANAKHWHYPYKNSQIGWQILVDWLNAQGYKVMVISKQATQLRNVIDKTGNFPIEHRINELQHSEFFIGVGSGLSWLAWAVKKKVVMISGFSDEKCEFTKNNIRIQNKSVCNSCFNRHEFDKGDWDWCPDNKNTDRQFECTINITPEMVIGKIQKYLITQKTVDFDFSKYLIKSEDIIIDKNKIKANFNSDENKIHIGYDNDELPKLNIDIVDYDAGIIYHTLDDVKISNKYTIWAQPIEKLVDKKLYLRFYTDKTILKLDL
jgi:autotransporter strand-loop-strand O-heptosyltransferase